MERGSVTLLSDGQTGSSSDSLISLTGFLSSALWLERSHLSTIDNLIFDAISKHLVLQLHLTLHILESQAKLEDTWQPTLTTQPIDFEYRALGFFQNLSTDSFQDKFGCGHE